jgi:uncharacterized protein (DUF1499 family)
MKLLPLFFIGFLTFLLSSCSQGGTPNFQAMKLPTTPNYYLVCPPKFCNVTPSEYSPVYPANADDLFNAFNQIISTDPYVHFVNSIPEDGEYFLEQRSLWGFPDDITIQFIALTESTSTLAIYSKSRRSYIDLGANKRMVNRWLIQLKQQFPTNGTEGRNRTDTVSPPPDFESGASTSSATPA